MVFSPLLIVCAASAVGAARLKGSEAPAPAAAPSGAPAGQTVGTCGCMRESQCTCDESLEYLKCVTLKCAAGCEECSATPFTKQCGMLSEHCGATLDFECSHNKTTCEGKFHQQSDGLLGLTLQTDHLADEALCGPWGKCLGKLRVSAEIHGHVTGAMKKEGLRLECAIPKHRGYADGNPDDEFNDNWEHCHSPDTGVDKELCILNMEDILLEPGFEIEGRCWLSDKKKSLMGVVSNHLLTKHAFFTVKNHHSTPEQPAKLQAEPVHETPKSGVVRAAGVACAWLVAAAFA